MLTNFIVKRQKGRGKKCGLKILKHRTKKAILTKSNVLLDSLPSLIITTNLAE